MIIDNRTEEQKAELRLATIAGKARHTAEMNGGTGDLRRKMAKASRKKNRK